MSVTIPQEHSSGKKERIRIEVCFSWLVTLRTYCIDVKKVELLHYYLSSRGMIPSQSSSGGFCLYCSHSFM